MTSRPEYLHYLASAKQAEVADQLRRDGFSVEIDKQVGEMTFDLVAHKDSVHYAYEFKSGPSPRTNKDGVRQLQEAATRAGFEFRIVVVNPPPRVQVEIEHLADVLEDYLVNKHFPDELDSLSIHTSVEGVSDISISEVHVGEGSVRVTGIGSVDVHLHYGRDSDDGSSSNDAFPFTFKVKLTSDGRLESVEEIFVDVSEFYE